MGGKPTLFNRHVTRSKAPTVDDIARLIKDRQADANNLREKLATSVGTRHPVILTHLEAKAILSALTEWAQTKDKKP